MFAWFFLSALYLQLVLGYTPLQVGLAFLPANLIMAAFSLGLSARLVMRFGIRGRWRSGSALAALGLLLFARAPVDGDFVVDVLPGMVAARLRRRHGVQPDAAGGDERRRAAGLRPRLGRRQHRLHDGRRARPRRARQPRRGAQPEPDGGRIRPARALNGGYHVAFVVGAAFAAAAAIVSAIRFRTGAAAPAHGGAEPAHGGSEQAHGVPAAADAPS